MFHASRARVDLLGVVLVCACSCSTGGAPASRTPAGAGGAAGDVPADAAAPAIPATPAPLDAAALDSAAGGRPADAAAPRDVRSDAPPAMPPADPGAAGDGDFTVGPTYATQPELTNRGAPHGKSFHFTMSSADSAIFKGLDTTLDPQNQHAFTRGIDVYVPAQYKDGTPAPLLIIQDGPGELGLVRNALDNLTIAQDPERRLPPFVAIAVANGGGDGKGSERGLEYDTMSDRYARFIQTEVLPAVLANPQIRAAYPKLAFTDDPDGKATLGCSSGGAAALIMGWFRPDLFRRLITYSGTFVDQQDDDAPEEAMYRLGAWEFHSGQSLIMNDPRKELRVFLNVNEMDAGYNAPESGHHNWVIANQRTAAALKAKGYHYRFVFAKGAGHCAGQVQGATLADALVWAWRGYAAP